MNRKKIRAGSGFIEAGRCRRQSLRDGWHGKASAPRALAHLVAFDVALWTAIRSLLGAVGSYHVDGPPRPPASCENRDSFAARNTCSTCAPRSETYHAHDGPPTPRRAVAFSASIQRVSRASPAGARPHAWTRATPASPVSAPYLSLSPGNLCFAWSTPKRVQGYASHCQEGICRKSRIFGQIEFERTWQLMQAQRQTARPSPRRDSMAVLQLMAAFIVWQRLTDGV
jgi:hypothetical protein